MLWNFPRIRTWSDIAPFVQDHPAFEVREVLDGRVISVVYRDITENPFPSWSNASVAEREAIPYWYECRGLKFRKDTGQIIARPFHKFKNLGESVDFQHENIDWSQPYTVYEKLDGSMVYPVLLDGELVWMTKAGPTEVSQMAAKKVTPFLEHFSRHCLDFGATPIFEYTGPYNQIVVSYPEEKLTLLAIRHMETGDYSEPLDKLQLQSIPSIPRRYQLSKEELAFWSKEEAQNREGVVVTFWNGHRVKVKYETYVLQHRAKESLSSNKTALEIVLREALDDVLPLLGEKERESLLRYTQYVNREIEQAARNVWEELLHFDSRAEKTPKVWALEHKPKVPWPLWNDVIFKAIRSGEILTEEDVHKVFHRTVQRDGLSDSLFKALTADWLRVRQDFIHISPPTE